MMYNVKNVPSVPAGLVVSTQSSYLICINAVEELALLGRVFLLEPAHGLSLSKTFWPCSGERGSSIGQDPLGPHQGTKMLKLRVGRHGGAFR